MRARTGGLGAHLRTHALGRHMERVEREHWPDTSWMGSDVVDVWLSRDYLAVLYRHREDGRLRLTVNRTRRGRDDWLDGITWDELQRVKNETVGPDAWCAEAYPPADDVVDVANMRHLCVLEDPATIAAVSFGREGGGDG